MLVVAVTGGRDFHNEELIVKTLRRMHKRLTITHVLHGSADGADEHAHAWAMRTKGVQPVTCPACWRRDGNPAGPIRNSAMVALLTQFKRRMLIAFPGGRGTADMVAKCKAAGISIVEIKEDSE